ncbi:Hint domain-containing protein [Oceaniglobus roseus]|uniref:Hint domain-containing protein n=1 Tax=Oceaniglobus roseus TaxID=1737570 RepID=UPI000C7EC411|nr:Hint domain-containing protein [Kandeliimicrobium roseum]
MAQYGIYVLGRAGIDISGGGDLSGLTQGDGSHLVGRTITLTSGNWQEMFLNDADTAFSDNDGSQTLNGSQSLDGVQYAAGSVVEAEYTLNVSHGGKTYQLIGFNINNSNPAYATVEGLAFIGGPGGFPPVGVPLTVTGSGEGPSTMQAADYARPVCFGTGTRIAVPGGTRAVEELRGGDWVCTATGRERVLWAGGRRFPCLGRTAPVRFAPGALGNERALVVSPQHRILVTRSAALLMFDRAEVLIPAAHFVNGRTVTRITGGVVGYHHLLLPRHAILCGDGVASESFYPGRQALMGLDRPARDEILALFPRLVTDPGAYGPEAGCALRRHEARALLAA